MTLATLILPSKMILLSMDEQTIIIVLKHEQYAAAYLWSLKPQGFSWLFKV
jgi:hypothetical protein